MPMTGQLGVGIIGAGAVTQAIHLPTLARLPDQFRVVTVMDVDAGAAELVAARAGAEPAQTVRNCDKIDGEFFVDGGSDFVEFV